MWILIFFFVVAIVVAIILGRYLRKRRRICWKRFADNNDLYFSLKGKSPFISGQLNGRSFRLRILDRSSDGATVGVELTEMTVVLHASLPEDTELRTAPFPGSAHAPQPAEHSLSTGNPEFDSCFICLGNKRNMEAFLTPQRQQALQELQDQRQPHEVALKGTAVHLRRRDTPRDRHCLQADKIALLKAAERLDSFGSPAVY